jgi:dephospho-CoA kinase
MRPHSDPDPASRPASRVVGVLGGIASGKSAVARLLAGEDGVVIDADRIARELLEEPAHVEELAARFGREVVRRDGRPDRDALAARVFSSPEERARLESWIHPLIRERIRATLEAAIARGAPRIVLDIPLLLENEAEHGLAAECDELVFVEADPALRDARAVAARGWRPGEVARREALQLPLDAKRARADHVIHNDGSLADLERAVRELRRSAPPPRRAQG